MLNRTKRRLAFLLFSIMLFNMLFQGFVEPVFARDGPTRPTVELNIYGNGSKGGPLFDTSGEIANGLWAPGITHSGILRIRNNYSDRVSIHNLGLRIKLFKATTNQQVTDEDIIREFAEAMELTIVKGKIPIFQNTIYNRSFYEMLYVSGSNSHQGYDLDILDRININKGMLTDFEYTVHMAESAGNNLQGLKATVDFIINSQENPTGKPSNDGGKDKLDRKDTLVEEPLVVIPDINGHWAHDCIVALLENDVIDPDSDSRIRPDDYITRAEAAVLIGRALKLEESTDISTEYVDNIPTWARGYVIATTKAKVFKGYPGKVFKSYGNISREEMTAVLIRAFRNDSVSKKEMDFTDKNMIAKWARGNIAAAVEEGIVTGYADDNTFRPKAYMTRAEAFTIVCKLLGYHDIHNKK